MHNANYSFNSTQSRRSFGVFFVLILFMCAVLAGNGSWRGSLPFTERAKDVPSGQAAFLENFGRMPMMFEANRGLVEDDGVAFLARGSAYTLFLGEDGEAVLSLAEAAESEAARRAIISMRLLGGNSDLVAEPQEALPGKTNYFIGNNPAKWRTKISNYAQVRYADVYPGVDLVYYGNQRRLEYDFIVAPEADPGAIRLAFEGIQGHELDAEGNLILATEAGNIIQQAPIIYQGEGDERSVVEGGYRLSGEDEIGFWVGAYDSERPLIIDPVLVYATYLGGGEEVCEPEDDYYVCEIVGSTLGQSIVTDAEGNAYITGLSKETDFSTTNAYQSTLNGRWDVYIAKLNPTGTALVFATYLGGSEMDANYGGMALDPAGNIYLIGVTGSTDFPTTQGAFETEYGRYFIAKLNNDGSELIYSTYLDSTGDYGLSGIAVDDVGHAYVTGGASSASFPTTAGAYQPTLSGGAGNTDAFVAKLNGDGSDLIYSTFLGGATGQDGAHDIAIDTDGNAYITGVTSSTDFPTTGGSLQTSHGGGRDDAFVTKLNDDGSDLVYSTYLGGSENDEAYAIAVDAWGNAYITGDTGSTDFPTENPYQPVPGLSHDAFITKMNSTGTALIFSTYLGGAFAQRGSDIVVDDDGNSYIAGINGGYTIPGNFPVTPDAIEPNLGFGFMARYDAAGTLTYATLLGPGVISGHGIALDPFGNIYITGAAQANPELPVTEGAYKTTFTGVEEAIVMKVALPVLTEAGDYVVVAPIDVSTGTTPLQMTFTQVTTAGKSSLSSSSEGPEPPAGFSLGSPPTYYDISTTAAYTPPVMVCLTYDPSKYADPAILSLLHYENDAWVDITNSNDTVNSLICGQVNSLSPFAIAELLNQPPMASAGGPYNVNEGSSISLDGTGSSDPDPDHNLTYEWDLDYDGATFDIDTTGPSPLFVASNLDGPDSRLVALRVLDNAGAISNISSAQLTVNNVAPTIALNGEEDVDEGSLYTLTLGAMTDPGDDTVTEYIVHWGDGKTTTYNAAGDVDHTYEDDPLAPTISVDLVDEDGTHSAAGSLAITVNNVPPTVESLKGPDGPVDIDEQPVSMAVELSDPGVLDTHDVKWEWGDGSSDLDTYSTSPHTHDHTYAEPGTYTVKVTVTDKDGGLDWKTYEYIVIYDPESSFVTGGGWIYSESGWCQLDEVCAGAEGKANFGFVSTYKKGANKPTGNTEFNFKAGGLNFHSSNYDWLVVNQGGTNAQYKGSGTINGEGDYHFMLWAKDLDPDGDDTFRIKIWYEDGNEVVVYDNGFNQVIDGGNIVVHTGKK